MGSSLNSMNMKVLVFVSLLVLSWIRSFTCDFTPADNYLIDCGSPTNTSIGNRVFVADSLADRLLSTPKAVLASNPDSSSSTYSRLYQTARVFDAISVYSFPIVRPGRHWIRLHFFPFVYQNFNLTSASFSVEALNFALLRDFRPSTTTASFKEFSLNVTSDVLAITFTPSSNSFAFINALEVVSVPDALITDDATSVNPANLFHGLIGTALETSYRVNMGGPMVSPDEDTLTRTWIPDESFLFVKNVATNMSNVPAVKYPSGGATPEIAPDSVYGTLTRLKSDSDPNMNVNVTWNFAVDPGFQYLVRFHFCDILSPTLNMLYFNVFIDSWKVAGDLDLSVLTRALATAYYTDYVTVVAASNKMSISIGPSVIRDLYPNAILNGLEIMKMNNSLSSLSSLPPTGSGSSSNSNSNKHVGLIAGLSIGMFVVLLVPLVLFYLRRRRRRKGGRRNRSKTWVPISMGGEGASHTMGSKYSNGTAASVGVNAAGYLISFSTLLEATNNFDENWVIGIGGFGKVYKGVMNDGTRVAVKRGNPRSQQGLAEFQTEIQLLSQFRHRHLVSLIGYCDENKEMILVYEYMEKGTVKGHLYGSDQPSLSWNQRLEICIGSARGLHYLHTGSSKAVIHRDVKSANILLDENFMAKVADFGLSKAGPEIDQTHVSTAVKGSFGYLDPEYFRRQQLTEKSDVYSFGVVLLEIVCARPVIDPSLPREMVNLAEWAMKYQKRGQLEQIIDRSLVGKIRPESLRKYGETAEKCLSDYGVDRPSMGDVLWNLEYALQLQEATVGNESPEEINSAILINVPSPPQVPLQVESETAGIGWARAQLAETEDNDLSGISMSRVFSQLVKSEGR